MTSISTRRLIKAKSQELLDTSGLDRPTTPTSPVGFASKMKKVLGYGSPLMKKKRTPSLQLGTNCVFGISLDDLLSRTAKNHSLSLPVQPEEVNGVPHIITKIVDYIEKHGLDQEGIYRVNGNAKVIEALRVSFDKVGDANFTDKDIYSIGGILKLFLRELPVSLVPDIFIDEIVQLQEANPGAFSPQNLQRLKNIISELPVSHFNVLKFLCKHLLIVSKHSSVNRMTVVSLSIVFGPNVFRCGSGMEGLNKQGNANAVFSQMIQNYSFIFEDLRSHGSSFSVDVLRSPVRVKNKEKPGRPVPYHKHKALKMEETRMKEMDQSRSWSSSPVHDTDSNSIHGNEHESTVHEQSIDEAIDEAFEAVIKEDMESREKKKRKSEKWVASVMVQKSSKGKGQQQNDDHITTRVPSPYSWRSSPGTSPSTSPIITPRTSQVYTNLIGDTVENFFFNPTTVIASSSTSTQQLEGLSTQSDTSSIRIPYTLLTSSPESSLDQIVSNGSLKTESSQPQLREGSVMRRNRTMKNRKSAVYGNTAFDDRSVDSTNDKLSGNIGDLNVQLLTVNDEQTEGVTSKKGKVSDLVKLFSNEDNGGITTVRMEEEKGYDLEKTKTLKEDETDVIKKKHVKLTPEEDKHKDMSRDREKTTETVRKEKPIVPPPPRLKEKEPSIPNLDHIKPDTPSSPKRVTTIEEANEFDYVTRESGTLFHPTLQRVRGPLKRNKPSRRSMLLKKERVQNSDHMIDHMTEHMTDKRDATGRDRKENSSNDDNKMRDQFEKDESGNNYLSKRLNSASSPSRLKKQVELSPEQKLLLQRKQSYSEEVSIHFPQTETPKHSPSHSPRQDRNISVSSITSVSTISRHDSLSSPPEITPEGSPVRKKDSITSKPITIETTIYEKEDPIRTDEYLTPVAPEVKPETLRGWSGGNGSTDTPDIGILSEREEGLKKLREKSNEEIDEEYEKLIRKAKRMRIIIKNFESNFVSKNGRKPTEDEKYPIHDYISSCDTIKSKLKAMRQTKLSQTAPPEVHDVESGETSVRFKDDLSVGLHRKTKTAGVRRHQSLIVSPTHKKTFDDVVIDSNNPLNYIQTRISSLLSDKRVRAGRPEDIKLMTFDQLMEEKQSIQKVLLHFERKHGRPQTSEDKSIMRPIYDRYRDVKKLASRFDGRHKGLHQSTHESLSSTVDTTLASVTILNSSLVQSLPTTSLPVAKSPPNSSMSFTLPLTSTSQPPNSRQPNMSSTVPTGHKEMEVSPLALEQTKTSSSPLNSRRSQSTGNAMKYGGKTSRNVFTKSASSIQLETERTGEWKTTQELQHASYTELRKQLDLVEIRKKELRHELRLFENDFKEKHGRPVENEDKKLKYEVYIEYKMVKSRLIIINNLLTKYLPQNTF